MLHFMLSQMAELDELHRRLGLMRVKYMRTGLKGDGSATLCDASEQEAKQIYDEVFSKYRSQAWKDLVPPPEDDPNPEVAKMLVANREVGMNAIMMLHRLVMQAPLIGCGSEGSQDEN